MRGVLLRCCQRLTRASLRHPRTTWWLGGLLAVTSLGLTAARLEMKTSNLDLVSPTVPEIARFNRFAQTFGTPNVLIVVLNGQQPEALNVAADQAAQAIRRIEGVQRVLFRASFSDAVLQALGANRYLQNDDGTARYLFVQPQDPTSSVASIEPLVRAVRRQLHEARFEDNAITFGLTGIPEYAVNDKEFIQQDLKRLSWLSLCGVFLIFVLGFRAWKAPLCAVLSLLISAAISLGVASLIPGHLTLLSASFISILFGLGIDFGIHVVKRYEENRRQGADVEPAVAHALDSITPSLLTGALTTALVFFSLLASGLKGFAELGWVAGVGVLISLVSMITLLPAGLLLTGRKQPVQPTSSRGSVFFSMLPSKTLWVLITGLTLISVFFPSAPYDSDYLHLEPKDSLAVQLERDMILESDLSPLFAVFTLPNEEQAAALADRLYDEPQIGVIRTLAGLRDLGLPEEEWGSISDEDRRSFVSEDGQWNVYAYPKENLWHPEAQTKFVKRMREIHPDVTGMPFIGQYMLEQSQRSLQTVSWLALTILAFCLWMDFRQWRFAFAAMLPTLMTFLLMKGLMRWTGLSFNPLNTMALPVILGIAVDDGVHLVHRVLEEGRVLPALLHTGPSIFLTTLTSLISFGLLGFARHQGLASFGQLLALGISCSLGVTLIWLPRVLPRLLGVPYA